MNSIYSVFYDDKGQEIFIPKVKPIKEKQAGEVLNKLFESTATKRQYNPEIRPVKKQNPRQLAEQIVKVAKNKKSYKSIIEKFLKDIEMYEKTGNPNNLNKDRDAIINIRNFNILFRK